jgi:hypothetical protein
LDQGNLKKDLIRVISGMTVDTIQVRSKTNRVYNFNRDKAKLEIEEVEDEFVEVGADEFANKDVQFILDAAEYLALKFPDIVTITPLVRKTKRATGMSGLGIDESRYTPPSTVSHKLEETKERPLE